MKSLFVSYRYYMGVLHSSIARVGFGYISAT